MLSTQSGSENALRQRREGLISWARLAAIVIGRNEGDRFRRCLDSLLGKAAPIVYVDSGSTDGSIEYASEPRSRRARARRF